MNAILRFAIRCYKYVVFFSDCAGGLGYKVGNSAALTIAPSTRFRTPLVPCLIEVHTADEFNSINPDQDRFRDRETQSTREKLKTIRMECTTRYILVVIQVTF